MKTDHKAYEHITLSSRIYDVMDHPAFDNWGHLIFPWEPQIFPEHDHAGCAGTPLVAYKQRCPVYGGWGKPHD